MKNYTLHFLIMTIVTGILGFAGLNFFGIEVVRVLFLIFADLLIVALISKIFFSDSKEVRLQRVKK
ncbi:uncharacterized protein DUF1328 [Gillisia mitskevichiae]|uniref:Uncharacterized protein DUF1328 n=1 Tax=Gillisia mitskevichiae TaxID=270921 RepID=A0A495P8I2_9FLAO|nr:DUF1328 domain-containing protein [Gillisia mitskevichiae]RKS45069.1 uncharacterized protein DUF1328 [Gillisia mitskevichiae]